MLSQLVDHPEVNFDLNNFEPLNSMAYEETDPWAAAKWAREFFSNRSEILEKEGRISGFKMSSVTVVKAPELWQQVAEDFNLRILYNYREDFFKMAVGRYPYYFLGDNSTVGGVAPGEERCSNGESMCKFEIESVENLHCVMTRAARVNHYMDKAVGILTGGTKCFLELPYSDYLKYPNQQMFQIQDFLGIRRIEIKARRKKATSSNMCDVVSNYAEVCAAFNECTDWHDMLNDVENNCTCSHFSYTSRGGDNTNPLCQRTKPPSYIRWCGGFNYEEDMKRIVKLHKMGEDAKEEYVTKNLDNNGKQSRKPTIIHR